MKPLVVEAKRPAHIGSLAANARAIRKQLRKRTKDGRRNGLAVFAADRILGLSDGDLVLDRASRLDAVLGNKVAELVLELQKPNHKLFPNAAIGAVLSTGAVFCVDPGFIVTISTMGFFCTGPEHDPLSVMLYNGLRPTLDHTHLIGR
ncbi:MAG TPA: hypothetical protein VK745_07195 [Polyangiaceae bacterium]|nr:hypothetical protein [Polyangiaceae bacterium]